MKTRDGRVVDLSEFAEPYEVWRAVEGDRSQLIALLRGESKLSRWTRDTLADWLECKIVPVKLPKGRPRKAEIDEGEWHRLYYYKRHYFGHDPRTALGMAAFRYELLRRFIRKKGWHLKSAGALYWSVDRLRERVAQRQEVDLEKFINYLNRPKPVAPSMLERGRYVERRRQQIAYEIHHAKKAEEG